MTLVVIGINHRTAPVEIREKVVFAATDLAEALRDLNAVPGVRESVIVSTCNRTELYCFTDRHFTDTPGAQVASWLGEWHDLTAQQLDLRDSLYQLHGKTAIEHVFSVACGLDSLVLGEPQILGQLKDAYRVALDHGVTGPYLNRLLQTAFSVAKRVRTETRIGANAVSVASATVAMARTVFENLDQHTALLVGAGETIALAARHLHANGLRRMIIANRSLDRAQELAREFDGYAIGLEALASHLSEADIVISSTASPTTVITYDAVRGALRERRRKPMFMADIAVPRDIDAEVAKLEDVYLFTIDDLQNVVNENIESRREAARDASQMIAAEIAQFEQQLKTLDAVPTIRQLRSDAEALRSQTTDQARRMLAAGRDPGEVIDFLATTLTNRLLHGPSQRLRDAAERGDVEVVTAARALLVSSPSAAATDEKEDFTHRSQRSQRSEQT
ncbi:glutamyl-tRNA reductase [Povalibacter sp.]|uniref:glutamyl-tRNA reductase n=1 Tax=Povalibacter sp. TaxID=1962978 RepID=UPI002F3E6E1E